MLAVLHTVYSVSSRGAPCVAARSPAAGAAAYGDDNAFLLGAKTLERAPLRVSCLVATTFFTQLFAYVTMVPLNHDESLVHCIVLHTLFLGVLLDAHGVGYTTWCPPRGPRTLAVLQL